MVTAPTGRPRCRPKKNFLTDPDRVVIAFAEGLILGRGESERVAYDLAVVLFSGDEVLPEKKPRGRRPKTWVHTAYKVTPGHGVPASVSGRAASLRQKWKRVQTEPKASLWMHLMAGAYAVVLTDAAIDDAAGKVRTFAAAAGESDLAESMIIPLLRQQNS